MTRGARGTAGEVRIIGGAWRGRRLRFPALPRLRPTPDRVRETLFNWLAPFIDGAHCLDLFAGSGVLALEALSRGAAAAVAVEGDASAAAAIRANARRIEARQLTVECCDVRRLLAGSPPARRFDIVFLDPPHDSRLYMSVANALESGAWLADHALIYVEAATGTDLDLPERWHPHRSGHAGKVAYRLLRRDLAPC